MVDEYEIVQKIESDYVGSDCVQVMFNYNHGLCIMRDKKIVFCDLPHDKDNEFGYVNNYLNDDRRYQFPYSDVPEHSEVINSNLYVVVNQILNFDFMYVIMRADEQNNLDMKLYCKAFKNQDTAIVVQSSNRNSSLFDMDINVLEDIASSASKPKIRVKNKKIRD